MTLILQYWSGSQKVFLVPNPTFCFQLPRPYLLVFNFSKLLSVLVTLERVTGVAAAEVAQGPPQGTAICSLHLPLVVPVVFPAKTKQQPPDCHVPKAITLPAAHPGLTFRNSSITFAWVALIQPPQAVQSLIPGSQMRAFCMTPPAQAGLALSQGRGDTGTATSSPGQAGRSLKGRSLMLEMFLLFLSLSNSAEIQEGLLSNAG